MLGVSVWPLGLAPLPCPGGKPSSSCPSHRGGWSQTSAGWFSYGVEVQNVSWWFFVATGMELGTQAWWLGDMGGTCPGHAAALCHLPGLEEPLFLLSPTTEGPARLRPSISLCRGQIPQPS